MTEDKLKELERLRAEATPGEWQEGIAGGADLVSFDGEDVRGVGCIQAISSRNLRYLIAACNAVPELIAEIRRQRKALGTFVEELEKAEEEAAGLEYRAEDAEAELARLREVRIEGLNTVPLGPDAALSSSATCTICQERPVVAKLWNISRCRTCAEEMAGDLTEALLKAEDKLARVREVLGRSNQGLGQNTLLALTIIEEPAGDGGG